MDILYIEFFDCEAKKIIKKTPYTVGMAIPRKGEYIRMESTWIKGLYRVENVIYYEVQKKVELKIIKVDK